MSLVFADGLDSGLSKYQTVSSSVIWNPTGGVYGGGCIQFPAAAADTHAVQFYPYVPNTYVSSSQPITRLSMWLKCGASITSEADFLYLFDGLANSGYFAPIRIANDGRIVIHQITNGPRFTAYKPTDYFRIDDGNWHHVEIGIKYHTSTSYIQLFIDGVQAGSTITSGDTTYSSIPSPGLINAFGFRNHVNGALFIDDVLVWNEYNTGDNFYESLGPTKIFTLRPEADNVASSTASSGSDRFAMINEPSLNTANYVTLSANTEDFYDLTNVANVRGQIIGVQSTVYFNSSQPGYQSNLRPVLVSNDIRSNGNIVTSVTTTAISATYRFNKNFGAANTPWTMTSINSLKAGFENIG